MSLVSVRSIFCDATCGQWHGQSTPRDASVAKLRRAAARDGWTRRDGQDFCPDHSDTRGEA